MPAITSLDLSNAKLDVDVIAAIANSPQNTVVDRLGNTKLTMQGAVNSIKAFNFRGARVSGTIYNLKDIYSVSGITYITVVDSFVAAPTVDTDLANGNVVVYQSGSFNSSISGAVERTYTSKLEDSFSVRDTGANGDGISDDLSAVLALFDSKGRVHFPRVKGGNTTYYLSTFTAGRLDGAVLSADEGVTLSLAQNVPYELYSKIKFDSDINVYFRDIQDFYIFPKTPDNRKKENLSLQTNANFRSKEAIDCTDTTKVICKTVQWPMIDGYVFTVAASTSTSDALTMSDTGGSRFRGAFLKIGPYETISAFFNNGTAPGPIGVCIRGELGSTFIYNSSGAGNFFTAFKPNVGDLQGNTANLSWDNLGQGLYTSFEAGNSIWSVTRKDEKTVIVKLNGKALTSTASVGNISEIGFICYNSTAFSVSGFTVENRTDGIIGQERINSVHIYGDSTAAEYPGSFSGYLHQLLDSEFGVNFGGVVNKAVVGYNLAQTYTKMQSEGFGQSTHVILAVGTNDIQGQTDLGAFQTTFRQVIDYIQAAGKKVVIVTPYMWYTQTQTGGAGQGSVNYEKGASYRIAEERIGFEKSCIVLKTSEELPNPDYRFRQVSNYPAYLRDNIHEDLCGYQMYAKMIAKGILDDLCALPGSVETILIPEEYLNGASTLSDFRFTKDKNGMASCSGSINVDVITNGTALVQVPRYLRPKRGLNINAQALSAGGAAVLGGCYLSYNTSAGTLDIQKAPTGTKVIIIDSASYKTTN